MWEKCTMLVKQNVSLKQLGKRYFDQILGTLKSIDDTNRENSLIQLE